MGHHLPLHRRYRLVLGQHSLPQFLSVVVVELRELLGEGFGSQPQALVGVVKPEFELEHEVPMVISEEKASMFTACGVIGDELVMEACGLNLIVGSGAAFWSWGSKGPEVSFLQTLKGREDAEHFEAPEVLLPLLLGQRLKISSDSDGLFHDILNLFISAKSILSNK